MLHRAILCLTLSLFASMVGAQASVSPGERMFIEGTDQIRDPQRSKNPQRGLELLRASAAERYDLAPYGLCVALSAEPEILNLVESYAWCRVAATRKNKFAEMASSRATEVLGRIVVHEGIEQVTLAKQRAVEYEAEFNREP
jgi:hypothetical protein